MHYCFQIALRHISVKGRGKKRLLLLHVMEKRPIGSKRIVYLFPDLALVTKAPSLQEGTKGASDLVKQRKLSIVPQKQWQGLLETQLQIF